MIPQLNKDLNKIILQGIIMMADVIAPGVIERKNIDCPIWVKAWIKKTSVTDVKKQKVRATPFMKYWLARMVERLTNKKVNNTATAN